MEAPGVAEMVHESISACPMDCRKALYGSVLTSGGTSMFPGFSTRLENELTRLWLENDQAGRDKMPFKIKIVDPPRRMYSVFMGSTVYATHLNSAPE